MRSKPGSQSPFELIPNHGSTHFPTGRDSKPRSTALGLSQVTGFRMFFVFLGGDDHDVSMGMTAPTPQNTTVIPRIQKPIRPTKTASLVAHDLFGRDGRGESFSTLRTAALQDGTPRLRLHSFSKAVFAQALDSARLICPLHRCGSSLSVIRFLTSRFNAEIWPVTF
jgi:hypothetical protein